VFSPFIPLFCKFRSLSSKFSSFCLFSLFCFCPSLSSQSSVCIVCQLIDLSAALHLLLLGCFGWCMFLYLFVCFLSTPMFTPISQVLHGADFDVQWLQRDFSVYIVNMFDTGQASRVLDYPKKSLAYLLELYCDIQADKQYQLADWRIRPLMKEMAHYAQQDTHYLLYIYDRLRSEKSSSSVIVRSHRPSCDFFFDPVLDTFLSPVSFLIPTLFCSLRNELGRKGETKEQDLVLTTLNRSRQLCLKSYQKPVLTATSYNKLYNKLRQGDIRSTTLCLIRTEICTIDSKSAHPHHLSLVM